jgi:iodotyrosine deiodinase
MNRPSQTCKTSAKGLRGQRILMTLKTGIMPKPKIIVVGGHEHISYQQREHFTETELIERSKAYYEWLNNRRSIRMFSDQNVPKSVIENLILAAGTAPSGAHKQPWTFCAIANPEMKSKIRVAAEAEEKESYEHRMSERWKKDLEPLGTDMHKPFLETAPWLIVAFKKVYEFDDEGNKHNNYYVNESVGIACGLLISAIHHAGLVTLTHTPSPMNFLATLLDRPSYEKAFILFPVGYPADEVFVPNIQRKTLAEISRFYE